MSATPSAQPEQIRSALFGLAVGDALGVPVETKSRSTLKRNPVTGMRGYGKYNQPSGTWSDDSSLAFCLADTLSEGVNLKKIAQNFIRWESEGFWSARGTVFDVGIATTKAINRLKRGIKPELAGGKNEESNGNGSLMRILPMLFYIKDKPLKEQFELTRQVSSITHAHIHSVVACFYYLEFAQLLIKPMGKFEVYNTLKQKFIGDLDSLGVDLDELEPFDRLLIDDIIALDVDEIESGGYVVDTLESSIWCLLTTESYGSAVLKAVNLGGDTDTTAAVTGGLAGLLYGYNEIPKDWIEVLARKDDIADLCRRLSDSPSISQ